MSKKRNFRKRPWTHKDALALLGEVGGITMEGSPDGGIRVFMEVAGVDILVIHDSGELIHHSVTRSGIMSVVANELARTA